VTLEVAALRFEEAEADDSANRLADLFERHHQRLYRLARRLSPSSEEARDAVQDTFVRAAQNLAKVPRGASSEEAWLVRVLVNLCRDRWRQRTNRTRLDAREFPLVASTESDEKRMIARDTIWRALDRLPMKRRAVLVMFELEGLPVASIGRALGMNPVTVRWHLSRGRRELAHIVRGEGTREQQSQ
jgi:RNA polymerase sigma-70 factor, ECF subfamily